MGTVSTDLIKQLRESTGAGILECRKALENANGDLKAAMESLREKGLATALKRSSRAASEGVIEVYTHGGGRVGVMLELNCETDFVGRSESFRYLAHELALQIAASSPLYISDEDIPQSVLDNEAKMPPEWNQRTPRPNMVFQSKSPGLSSAPASLERL